MTFGNIQGDGRKFLGHFKRHSWATNIRITHTGTYPAIEVKICIKGDFEVWLQSVNGQVLSSRSIVLPTSALGKRALLLRNYRSRPNVWTWGAYIYNTHTKGNKYDKTHFLLQIFGLFASYDPVWMILMIFVVYKIYLAYKISKELPLNCLLGYYMTFISWFHPKIACNISAQTFTCCCTCLHLGGNATHHLSGSFIPDFWDLIKDQSLLRPE